MSSLKTVWSCLAFCFLAACSNDKAPADAAKDFFDLGKFMETQILELKHSRPALLKTIRINGSADKLQPRDTDWDNELGLFLQANLNKPALRDSYTVSYPDSLSILYEVKEGENLPVKYLLIAFFAPGKQVKSIEAVLSTSNKLYQSEKKLTLNCLAENGKERIASYTIDGYQKLIVSSRKTFSVEATIL